MNESEEEWSSVSDKWERQGIMPIQERSGASDDILYKAYLNGDTVSYDQLMIRYGDSLTLFLYGYLHDWQDAEDLMIEAFAEIMAKMPRIREGCFKAYLFKTARNLAVRFHTRRSRIRQFSLDEHDAEFAAAGPADNIAHDIEIREVLQKCIGRIDSELREALWLVYYEGMSYAEAASVMKVNTKRIDHLLDRGKRQMRTELEKEGIADAYR